MTVWHYPNGTGGVLGDELVTETELYSTGFIYYVHSGTGSDSNSGVMRQKPFASLVHALTLISANDIIVMLDGHTETISAPQTLSLNGIRIVAEGSNNGVSTVRLTSSLNEQTMFTISGINVTLGNIYFPEGGTNATVARVIITGVKSMVRGCYFECGAGDANGTVDVKSTATGARFFSTSFVNVSTTTQPTCGLLMEGMTDCELEAVTVDGGTVGFSVAGILDSSAVAPTTAPLRLRCQQMRMLNGAGLVTGSGTTGYVGISEKSGAPVVAGFSRRLPLGFRQTGDAMLADTEFYTTGDIFYVHYGTGDDANAGTDELAPKKTVASALSVLATGCDIIVLLPGHDEAIAATVFMNSDGVTVVGCGTSDGKPTCKLHSDNADPIVSMETISYLRNVWLYDVASESGPESLVDVTASYCEIRGCYMVPTVNSVVGVAGMNSYVTYRETSFVSGGSAVASRPAIGLQLTIVGSLNDIDVRGCVFSNAEHGFSSDAFHDAVGVTRLYVIAMSQLYGADVTITASATGIINPEHSSGSASVTW